MKKELKINGQSVDINDTISLQWKSFLFAGINEATTPRSWTVTLPPTERNRKVIEQSNAADYTGTFPFSSYTVDYWEDEYQIISGGVALFRGATAKGFNFVFTFGAAQFNLIKAMSALKLTELSEAVGDYLEWNQSIDLSDMSAGFGWCNWYSFTNEDRSYTTSNADLPFAVLHPCVKLSWLIDKMTDQFPFDFSSLSAITKMDEIAIPLKRSDGLSTLSTTAWNSGSNASNSSTLYKIYFNITVTNYCIDISGNTDWVKETAVSENSFDIKINSFETYTATTGSVLLVVKNKSGVERTITAPNVVFTGGRFKWSLTDYTFQLNSDDELFYFKTLNFQGKDFEDTALNFNVIINSAVYSFYSAGGFFPIIPNLPDMSCADFIFQCMQLAGVFPFVDPTDDTVLLFDGVGLLYDNLGDAVDWSGKLLKTSEYMADAEDIEYTFGAYAQQNTLKYKQDDTNTLDTSGVLTVTNTNLESEKELVSLLFGAGKRFSKTDSVIDYVLYDIKIDSTTLIRNAKSPSNDVLAKIVDVSGVDTLKFTDDMLFSEIVDEAEYTAYQTIINQPRVIKERFYLSAQDVAELSLETPVYLMQYGKYYAILEMQKQGDFAECKLLELKNIT